MMLATGVLFHYFTQLCNVCITVQVFWAIQERTITKMSKRQIDGVKNGFYNVDGNSFLRIANMFTLAAQIHYT